MPIREYKCSNKKCKNFNNFEILHLKVGECALTSCPECGHTVKMLMSSFSAKFVGDGFYVNDYKKANEKKKKSNKKE